VGALTEVNVEEETFVNVKKVSAERTVNQVTTLFNIHKCKPILFIAQVFISEIAVREDNFYMIV
jgi:hypothetical protein